MIPRIYEWHAGCCRSGRAKQGGCPMPKRILSAAILSLLAVATLRARAETTSPATKAYAEMKQMLGLVPTFLKELPEEVVADAWDEIKGVQLNPKSAIPGQY